MISVVIPVYNSTSQLENLIRNINSLYGDRELELILVNDASTNPETHITCLRINEQFKNIRYLELNRNFGQHNAIMAGIKNSSGDLLITIDDDGQHPASEILKLITAIETTQSDVVYGRYETKKHGLFRNFFSYLNDIASTLVLGKPKNLYLSSFRIMNKVIIDQLKANNNPLPYIDGLILATTKHITEVTVQHDERKTGSSNYNFSKLIGLWLNMMTGSSTRPLRFLTIVASSISVISFVFVGFIVLQKLFDPSIQQGWTSTLAVLVFLTSLNIAALGIVGEYVARALMKVNNIPQFVIRPTDSRSNNESSL